MKCFLLSVCTMAVLTGHAQNKLTALPSGTYEVQPNAKFGNGNIILLDDSHYKLSNENAVGDFKFSATAQRILFLTGTLRGAYAKAAVNGADPAIVLPLKENEEAGFTLVQADLWAFYKKN